MLRRIPPRAPQAETGSAFAARTADRPMVDRQRAAVEQVLQGNVPDHCRRLVPLRLQARYDGPQATVWLGPDYLSIGDNTDFIRWPFSWPAVQTLVRELDIVPPTRRIVDATYCAATCKLEPQPMPPTGEMMTNSYIVRHHQLVEQQRAAVLARHMHGAADPVPLTAGHKKDLVLSLQLAERPGRLAIYGWHLPGGQPIQPVSTAHGQWYADYSHGLRPVWNQMRVGDRLLPVLAVLADPATAPLLSDEGALRQAAQVLGLTPAAQC